MNRAYFVSILFGYGLSANASLICEAEMSPPSRAVYVLLKDAATLGMIENDELRDFISQVGRPLPLSSRTTDINNLDYDRAVADIYEGLSEPERREVRQSLASFLKIRELDGKKVETAREETRAIISPRLLPEFPFQNPIRSLGRLSPSEFEGRPVFLGKYDHVERRYVLVDPFHPDKNLRLRDLGTADFDESSSSGRWYSVFEKGGKSYAGFFDEMAYFDLTNDSPVNGTDLGFDASSWPVMNKTARPLVKTPYGSKLLIPFRKGLLEFDFSSVEPDMKKLVIDTAVRALSHQVVDGRNLVSFVNDQNHIYVYDIDRPGAKPEMVKELLSGLGIQEMESFQEGDDSYLLLKAYVHTASFSLVKSIQVLNLRTKELKEFPAAGKLSFDTRLVRIGDEHHVVCFLGGKLNLGNLKSQTYTPLREDIPERLGGVETFRWKDEAYLIYMSGKKSLVVYNLQANTYFEVPGMPEGGQHLHLLEYAGIPYALLNGGEGGPRLIRLATETPSGVPR